MNTVEQRPTTQIGRRAEKLDGVPKVSGSFEYSSDLNVAGMLYGATARSAHPHARIISVDITKAETIPGVRAVLTAEHVPGRPTFGIEVPDQPVLAFDRVRFLGEPVAVVAAEDPIIARQAARAVEVAYDVLDPVVDPELALSSEPLLESPDAVAHGWHRDQRPNVVRTVIIRTGDPDASGHVVVRNVYELGTQDPAFLGPESGLAVPDGTGGVDIHVATQWLHQDLWQIVPSLGLEPDQVRIHLAGVGGAFGGREDLSGQIHVAMLALCTGRPVKFMYSRDESFVGHVHRHPAKIYAEHRALRDGTLVSVRMRTILDGGAYASGSPAVTGNAAVMAAGPYRVPNAQLEATTVYTNNPPCGAMRGFGVVQVCYAAEAQMDALARMLEMDPAAIRLKNALEPGDTLPTGERLVTSFPLKETIRRCAELPLPEPEPLPRDPVRLPGGTGNTTRGEGVRRGVGFAVAFKNACYSLGYDDSAHARIRLFIDSEGRRTAEVHTAAVEFGQGLTNVIDQVVHSELDVDDVILAPATTRDLESSGSTSASRQTWMTAGALRACCGEIHEELARRGGRLAPDEDIDIRRTYHHRPTSPLDPETGRVMGVRSQVAFSCVAMRAVVEVDVELGLVRVVWIGTSQDVGKAVNPLAVEGQIEGGVAQGLGLALMEEVQLEGGRILNSSFTDYLIPTALDVSPVEIDLIEDPEPSAPYGLKGVGEAPTVVSTAAIAAAVRDATGLDLRRVPIRPEHIALARGGQPSAA